jgi:alkane 1-monooxygenase
MSIMNRYFKYLWAFGSMAIAYAGIIFDGVFTWGLMLYAFVLVPLLELFLSTSKINLTKEDEEIRNKDSVFDVIIYSIVPLHYGLLILFCINIQRDLELYELIGKIFTFGLACGVYGINVAHELGHRVLKHEQIMAKALLLTSQYMHFFIEHNRGHHNKVSTVDDPASSRFGEPIYIFWFRSVYGCFISAWELEAFRLRKAGRNVLSVYNEMIWYQVIQIGLLLTILFIFNWQTMLFYWASAVIGFLLLETVNYIEHYGLQRHKGEHSFHKVLPVHSWNSNHLIGRGILFELSRHSDHHFRANRKYQILRHHDDSPQMPTGYPGMMVLSLFPPLWFKVMNPRVKELKSRFESTLA